ncbi:MAG: hypothetical protein LBS42_00980 [Tannerella sp.]|nr:hypothetical protein [Tannerella sp.]
MRKSDLFEGDKYHYRYILTNDWESSETVVIEYDNRRGAGEKTFDVQNNGFGWGHLPCSDMNHNTVYLILTAMIKNFYNHIAQKVSEVFDGIQPQHPSQALYLRSRNMDRA